MYEESYAYILNIKITKTNTLQLYLHDLFLSLQNTSEKVISSLNFELQSDK